LAQAIWCRRYGAVGCSERSALSVILDVDRHKRIVGLVYLNGKNVNEEMVRLGLAWAYRRYLDTPYASEFIGAENEAREKGLGLWKQANPLPPWEFRRRRR